MATATSKTKPKIQIPAIMRRSSSSNSDTHFDESPHSPLRFHSPLRSDAGDPPETPPYASPINSFPVDNSKAIVAVDKCAQFSPLPSPLAPVREEKTETVVNKAVREREGDVVRKVGRSGDGGGGGGGGEGEVGAVSRRWRREERVRVGELGFRVCEMVLCMISFSVMAADKTQGWSGDSFDRYKEYRYCLSMNVIGFVYSGFQAYDLGSHIVSGKHVIRHHFRRHFNFFMDQIIAYLLMSASSSAATRVDDWVSNWGKDEFTEMATASIAMSFLAFIAFAISALISGYNLCNHD